jgi:putative salt-induced outer membrane protein YdiY
VRRRRTEGFRTTAGAAALAAALAVAYACPARAEAAPQAPQWETAVALGINVTRGNSKTLLSNLSSRSTRKGALNETQLGVEGNYGETEVSGTNDVRATQTNVQNGKGNAVHRRLFGERNYGVVTADLAHDRISGVSYRLIVGPGLGRYFLKDGRTTLLAECGLAHVRERVAGNDDDRTALRLFEQGERKIGEASRVWQSAEYLPTASDVEQYLLHAEAGAEAAMNAHLSLRTVLQNQFNSRPEPRKERSDLLLIAGLSCKF